MISDSATLGRAYDGARFPLPFAARCAIIGVFTLLGQVSAVFGQSPPPVTRPPGRQSINHSPYFDLTGGTAHTDHAVLKRDRAEITFDGTFYFEATVDGGIRGAVFLGNGKVHADAPDSPTERANLSRMIHADSVDSTFQTAVLRFSDDTMEALGLSIIPGGSAPAEAQKLATDLSPRLLRETGANVPARIAVSILNHESPGFFLAEFDKGSRGRFYLMLDHQGRLPTAHFALDAGEKGLFFAHDQDTYSSDVWMAFYSLSDYEKRLVEYSDAHAVVNIGRYDMDIDVTDWKHMKMETRIQMTALTDGVRAIPLMINETLSEYDETRLRKAMRVKSARLASGEAIGTIQEDWEGGLTLLLPAPLAKGQVVEPVLDFEGEFLFGDTAGVVDAHYVRADCWYPRHVELNRSVFDMTFRHKKGTRIVSIGKKIREEQESNRDMVTEWRMDVPVDLVTFAVGDFEVSTDKSKMESGGDLDLDFYQVRSSVTANTSVKADFVLAELGNCVRYFSALFGPYPYSRFGAALPSLCIRPRICHHAVSP